MSPLLSIRDWTSLASSISYILASKETCHRVQHSRTTKAQSTEIWGNRKLIEDNAAAKLIDINNESTRMSLRNTVKLSFWLTEILSSFSPVKILLIVLCALIQIVNELRSSHPRILFKYISLSLSSSMQLHIQPSSHPGIEVFHEQGNLITVD
jgi:hypothetical protein